MHHGVTHEWTATSSPAATATTASPRAACRRRAAGVRARVSVWLAGRTRGRAAAWDELIYANSDAASRSPACARHARTVLCAMPARRSRRGLERRALLGRVQAAHRRGSRRPSDDRPVDRKEHRAASQLRRRAHAIRQAVSGRRCGSYRAADRCQGTQPGGERRLLPLRSPARFYRERSVHSLDEYSARAPPGSGGRCGSPVG